MNNYTLEIQLVSDTAFGSGAGISAQVNSEIQHDHKGLPTLSGRAIKGLLVNECSEILYLLPDESHPHWKQVALTLFGQRGEMLDDMDGVFISDATIAPDLVAAIHADKRISQDDILNSLTTVRRQTAMNVMGAPEDDTLRSIRVLIQGLTLFAHLSFLSEPDDDQKALLAACVMSLRRAGLNRNRGMGRIKLQITNRSLNPETFAQANDDFTDQAPLWFEHFSTFPVEAK